MKKHTNSKTQKQPQLIEQAVLPAQAQSAKKPGVAISSGLKAGFLEPAHPGAR